MKNRIVNKVISFIIAFPIVFVMFFFGYFPLHYDIELRTDNIVGEGICQTLGCPTSPFAVFYKSSFYFGSELKRATIQGYHYDVDNISFIVSDVSAFDICSIDSYWHGIHLAHFDSMDLMPDGEELTGTTARLVSKDSVIHVKVFDPDMGTTVSFKEQYIPSWFWLIYILLLLLTAGIFSLLLGFIFDRIPHLLFHAVCAAGIMATLLAGCFFCGSLPYVSYTNFLLNWLFLFAVSLILNALTLPFLGTLLTMVFTTFWYIANYFVIMFRNKPIMPADLKAIGTAKEVMGGYTLSPNWQMLIGVIIVILYAVIVVYVWKKNRQEKSISIKKELFWRGEFIIAGVLLVVIGINTPAFKNLNSFAWDMILLNSFHEEGMVTTYLKSVFNSVVKEPEGYSRELVSSYLSEYQKEQSPGGIQPTNIIMVMNEAFSDLRTVGLDPAIDVMPYIDSLKNDTVEGKLYVGVFGGGTCNTEFEALTGNSLAFLGPGAYPYTENVTRPLFSLAQYFKSIGYSTDAFHANEPQNWNRNMAYPNLGFNSFHSIRDFESFGEVPYLHDLPADKADYQYIEAVDEEKKGQKRFLFDVTMQNHSDYERWLDVEKAKSVAQKGDNLYVDTQVYLSLIKASDDEVRQLVETYRDSLEPTMIIFFGDHQPGLPLAAINELYTDTHSNLDYFKTKFFIWTNYDTREWHNAGISANYLPWLILERGNFPLPPYVQMLKEMYEHYPIITSQGVIDIKGNIYTGVGEVMDDPLIQKYQYIQYANLFDEIDDAWFKVN